jgi:transposase
MCYRCGHSYLTLVANADVRKFVFVSKAAVQMSPRFKGISDHLPKATITFDKFHLVAHASRAVDEMRAPSG